jgi:hypothetical protein
MASQTVPLGTLTAWSGAGAYNTIVYTIQQQLAKMQTATLVRVEACTNSGDLSPVGLVNITPLVDQVAGDGTPIPHVTIFDVPYMRLQGGANAVIIDPQPGDIGIAVFASRDISAVQATRAQALPGSYRQFDFADGLYVGGVLNGAPQQYLRFSTSGVEIVATNVAFGASGAPRQTLMTKAFNDYWNESVLPFLESKGFTGGPAPDDSLTANVEAS